MPTASGAQRHGTAQPSLPGRRVEVLSADPLPLTRFTRHVRRVHRVPRYGDDPLGWFEAALRMLDDPADGIGPGTQAELEPEAVGADRIAMFRIPPPEFVDAGARALRTTLAGDGPLDPVPAGLITAVTRDVFGHPLDPTALAPISFEEVARAIPDPGFRHQLVGGAIAMGMTVHPPDPAIATRARDLATALGVDEPMLAAFERSAEGHRYWMLADYARHSWATDEVKREVREGGIRKFVEQFPRMKGHGADDELTVARWAGLADLPDGSWGRAVSDFYTRHHWPLPGQRGSVPMVTTHHDWAHVASGYEATPLGEIQVNAFMAAQMPDATGLSMLFFGWSIYETGMLKVPLSPGAVGTIGADPQNATQVADALRRGSESGVDLLDLDHWAHAHRPLAEIREELGIGPKRVDGPDSAPAVPTVVA